MPGCLVLPSKISCFPRFLLCPSLWEVWTGSYPHLCNTGCGRGDWHLCFPQRLRTWDILSPAPLFFNAAGTIVMLFLCFRALLSPNEKDAFMKRLNDDEDDAPLPPCETDHFGCAHLSFHHFFDRTAQKEEISF